MTFQLIIIIIEKDDRFYLKINVVWKQLKKQILLFYVYNCIRYIPNIYENNFNIKLNSQPPCYLKCKEIERLDKKFKRQSRLQMS